jgi:hypothetical protein
VKIILNMPAVLPEDIVVYLHVQDTSGEEFAKVRSLDGRGLSRSSRIPEIAHQGAHLIELVVM